jgi:hypothetical protein
MIFVAYSTSLFGNFNEAENLVFSSPFFLDMLPLFLSGSNPPSFSPFCLLHRVSRPAPPVGDVIYARSPSISPTPAATVDAASDRTLVLLYALSGVFALLIFALAGLCITQRVSSARNRGVSMEPLIPDEGETEPPARAAAEGTES